MIAEVKQLIDYTISNLSRGSSRGQKSPHKLIFLLTIAELCSKTKPANYFSLNDEMDAIFARHWNENVPSIPYSTVLIELPYHYLQSDGFWYIKPKDNYENQVKSFSRLTRHRIVTMVDCGYLSSFFFDLLCASETRSYFVQQLRERLRLQFFDNSIDLSDESGRGNIVENPFVSYVNSLHCLDGDCDGALAERQAREPYFCQIHVTHPIVSEVYTELTTFGGHRHVILTGHAGDGKSTIALELYKRLRAIPVDEPLEAGLPPQAEIDNGNGKIILIKDLSEWTTSQQDEILSAMRSGSSRYFLISNTGCLLALFCRHAESLGRSAIDMEGELLTAMDSGERQGLDFGGFLVSVYNLALHDNIEIAMELWDKLTRSGAWDECKNCPMAAQCPIYKNLAGVPKLGPELQKSSMT